jgi:hypothetical protein
MIDRKRVSRNARYVGSIGDYVLEGYYWQRRWGRLNGPGEWVQQPEGQGSDTYKA